MRPRVQSWRFSFQNNRNSIAAIWRNLFVIDGSKSCVGIVALKSIYGWYGVLCKNILNIEKPIQRGFSKIVFLIYEKIQLLKDSQFSLLSKAQS